MMLFIGDDRIIFVWKCVLCDSLSHDKGFLSKLVSLRVFWEPSSLICVFYFSCSLTWHYGKVRSWVPPVPELLSLAHCGKMTHSPDLQDCKRSKVVLPLLLWPAPRTVLYHSWSSDQLIPEEKRELKDKFRSYKIIQLLPFTSARLS